MLDFGFDAWGGNFRRRHPLTNDDAVPSFVADTTGAPEEDHGAYVLERGNLEVNGAGVALLNWDCQDDRNPGLSQAEHEAILRESLGLTKILWAYGHDRRRHPRPHRRLCTFSRRRHGRHRRDVLGRGDRGRPWPPPVRRRASWCGFRTGATDYMNWLVGDGFVVGMAFGDAEADGVAEALLTAAFVGRDVYMIDATSLWESGGGVHCVTNDQPAAR
ncbi:MAG: agmatine deiminase family protein [Sandaracinaceae bacterium]|nr:agmatine deiminase family protein [Sandaracinaceae bacterium]